jgi:hypothetical protein
MELVGSSIKWFQAAGLAIGQAANPTINIAERATKGWALTELHEAVLVMAAYAVLVAIGIMMRPSDNGEGNAAKGGSKPKKSGPLSWVQVADKFGAQPVTMTLSLVYNITQVCLCVWMVVFTAQQAWKAGYPQHIAETVSYRPVPSFLGTQRRGFHVLSYRLAYVLVAGTVLRAPFSDARGRDLCGPPQAAAPRALGVLR